MTCLEALVRWQHPTRGLLLPSEFLSVAESSELIEPLTSWVLRRALADYTAWTAAGHPWMVAVNVSARNLTSPKFAGRVNEILHEAGVPPERLHLEVSETALAFDAELQTGDRWVAVAPPDGSAVLALVVPKPVLPGSWKGSSGVRVWQYPVPRSWCTS